MILVLTKHLKLCSDSYRTLELVTEHDDVVFFPRELVDSPFLSSLSPLPSFDVDIRHPPTHRLEPAEVEASDTGNLGVETLLIPRTLYFCRSRLW